MMAYLIAYTLSLTALAGLGASLFTMTILSMRRGGPKDPLRWWIVIAAVGTGIFTAFIGRLAWIFVEPYIWR